MKEKSGRLLQEVNSEKIGKRETSQYAAKERESNDSIEQSLANL